MTAQISQTPETLRVTWYYWLFPLIALAIGGWLFVDYFRQRGPTIKILFADASNIQANKTQVRYRGVVIGMVKKLTISEDHKDVIAELDLHRDTEQFTTEGSKFWVVVPKVNFSGISGLETLFEGTYIAVQPGPADGEFKSDFRGQLGSDTNEALENTMTYYLETPNAESLGTGDAVTFRGVNIGTIVKVSLNKTSQAVVLQINIQNKYSRLVRTHSAFWKKVGIQGKLGLFGSEFKMNSMESILHGGIELGNPDDPGELVKVYSHFRLLPAAPKDYEKWNPKLEL